jgi:hypothetical protein
MATAVYGYAKPISSLDLFGRISPGDVTGQSPLPVADRYLLFAIGHLACAPSAK